MRGRSSLSTTATEGVGDGSGGRRSATVDLPDLGATRALGRRLAREFRAGDVVLLEGDLGAGKSELARAVIRARAGADIPVPSPTFTLLQVYDGLPGELELGHADLYRLNDAGEALELGLEDRWAGGVLLVEWPDRAAGLWPGDSLRVRLEEVPGAGTGVRRAHLSGRERWAGFLAGLATGEAPG